MNWYVIRTVPIHGVEFSVRHALNQREHMALVPFEEKIRQHPRTKRLHTHKYPLFPGYVIAAFANVLEFQRSKLAVNEMMERQGKKPAIVGIIGPRQDHPWVMSDDQVEWLKQYTVEGTTEVNLHKGVAIGQEFMMLDGPYQGHVAKLKSIDRKRIKATMLMFGAFRDIEVPATTAIVAA